MQIDTARLFGLLALMAIAVVIDIRTRKIPNTVILAGAVVGIGIGLLPGGIGFTQSIGGLGVGLAFMLPMYALRVMGAGDAKLMACVGTFLGIYATVAATLFTFIAGGVFALIYSARAGILRKTLFNLKMFLFHSFVRVAGRSMPSTDDMPVGHARMPYSLAIAAGTSIYLAVRFYSTGVLGGR